MTAASGTVTGQTMLGDLAAGQLRLVDQICHARADLMSIGTLVTA